MAESEIKIKYSIDTSDIVAAQLAFDKLTAEEQDSLNRLKQFNKELDDTGSSDSFASLQAQADKLRSAISKLSPASDEFKKKSAEFKKVAADLAKLERNAYGAAKGIGKVGGESDKAGGSLKDLVGKLGPLGPAIAGAFSVAAIVNFGKAALDVTGRFQSLEAVLKNTLGSDSAAQGALVRIKEIASTTPFSVEELTASFVKLANQGFKPTNAQIVALGDLASSTGKSFDMLAEAIIDAQVGEFERLKEFGIRASKQGDQVSFTFKGVTTTVNNTSSAIREYITSLGGIEGVAGAMAGKSATLEGAVSNLGDAWDAFLNSIGNNLAPVYMSALQATSAFLTKLKDLFQTEEGALKERQGQSYNLYTKQLEKASNQAVANLEVNSAKRLAIEANETKRLEQELAKRIKDAEKARTQIIGGGSMGGVGAGTVYDSSKIDSVKQAQKALSDQKKIEADLKAMNQAAMDVAKARAEQKKTEDAEAAARAAAAAAKREAQNKKDYADAVKQVELEKQLQQERMKQTVDDPEQLAISLKEAEMEANIKLYTVSKTFGDKGVEDARNKAVLLKEVIATQNREISDQYKADAEKDRKFREEMAKETVQTLYKAEMDGVQERQNAAEAEILKMAISDEEAQQKILENDIKFNEERIKITEQYGSVGLDEAKKANDALILENAKKNRELKKSDKEAAADRVKVFEESLKLGQTVVDGLFNLYQQNLSAEMSALQARYDEEIRLADGNQQKVDEINQRKREKEKEIRIKSFKAEQTAAVARVIFETASMVAKWASNPVTLPLATLALVAQAAQIGFILSQPVPEYAEGTKGKKHRGGKAMVGERGVERIVTESGQVYYTPPTATLLDLPKGSQVIPNHLLSREEIAYATMGRNAGPISRTDNISGKLDEIGGILRGLPIHQVYMDERGFQKFIRTPSRSTKILNNQFGTK